jgi:S-adenosylmethionine synthetase
MSNYLFTSESVTEGHPDKKALISQINKTIKKKKKEGSSE